MDWTHVAIGLLALAIVMLAIAMAVIWQRVKAIEGSREVARERVRKVVERVQKVKG